MNASLREHLDAVGSTDTAATATSKFIGGGGAVDWKKLVEELPKQSYGVGKSRAVRLFGTWESLRPGEMASKLQEIDTLDLCTRKSLRPWRNFSCLRWCQKRPRTGTLLGGWASSGRQGFRDYASSFRLWAMKDLTRATEWLDREIAAGRIPQPVSGRKK